MKKVLYLTNLPTPYRIDFYNELGKHCDLTVIIEAKRSKDLTFNWNDEEKKNFNLIFLNKNYLNEQKINYSVLSYLSEEKFDIFVISCYHTFTGMLSLLYLKMKGIPYIFETDGGMISENESFLKRIYKRFLISGARAYFSTGVVCDNYLTFYGAKSERIFRTPFSSIFYHDICFKILSMEEKQLIRKRLGITKSQIILGIGQFIPRKGFDILMKVAANLSKDVGVYIIGGTPPQEYLDFKKQYNLTNVYFLEFKTKKELSCFFKASDIFVHPTREDIWGLVINEAMAHGLPVITTTKCVAGMELITEKKCIIQPDSPEQLQKILEELLEAPNWRKSISIKNLNHIQNHTIERMVEEHIKVFRAL